MSGVSAGVRWKGAVVLAAVAAAALFAAPAFATGYQVTSPLDDGVANLSAACNVGVATAGSCTLRDAIAQANNDPNPPAVVGFSINTGPQTITIAAGSTDIQILNNVTVDGTTQPGYGGTPVITIDGSALTNTSGSEAAEGLTTVGTLDVVKALNFQHFNKGQGSGVWVAGDHGTIVGNTVGTTADGTAAAANTVGIRVSGNSNTIGGTTAAARNVVSGNAGDGIIIAFRGGPATGNVVEGNYIGVAADGVTGLPNQDGVVIDRSTGNTIGGTAAGARNVIARNSQIDVDIGGQPATLASGNVVQGNYIGVDAAGKAIIAAPRATDGLDVSYGQNTAITGNVIASHQGMGVTLFADSAGSLVQGNTIGLDATGAAAGNNTGVLVSSTAPIKIGGADAASGNEIADNLAGVVVSSPISGTTTATTGVVIDHNSIHDNVSIGIDLTPTGGVTANDTGDADTGSNDLQNYPVISASSFGAGGLTVSGTLDTQPGTYRLEFFQNATCSPSGNGEGKTFVAQHDVTVTTSPLSFSFTDPTSSPGAVITATATNLAGSPETSEFSACSTAAGTPPSPGGGGGGDTPQAGPTYTVNTTADHDDGVCGTTDCTLADAIDAANLDNVNSTIAFDIPGSGVQTITALSGLPGITTPVTIDGFSQPGASANTNAGIGAADNSVHLIQVKVGIPNCLSCPLSAAIHVSGAGANGTVIRGLALSGATNGVSSFPTFYGIELDSVSNVTVAGNFVGTTAGGVATPEQFSTDVYVNVGTGNTIGGGNAADRNLIDNSFSGTFSGVDVANSSSTTIRGNYIGVGPDGVTAIPNSVGVDIFAGSSTSLVTGNVISGNTGDGVDISGTDAGNNTVTSNRIGTTADGTAALGNEGTGVFLSGGTFGNTIGGAALAANVISGNAFGGVEVSAGDQNQILGNLVGLSAGGSSAIGNGFQGVNVTDAATRTVVSNNVVSANASDGILVDEGQSGTPTGTVVTGNLAGTTQSGSTALGNGGDGIHLRNITGTVVGGTTAANRNVASGNAGHGIHVEGGSGNTVEGNYAGTNAAGTAAIQNQIDGIAIDASANNVVGGSAPGAGNVASGNHNQGISVFDLYGSATDGNTVEGNLSGLAASGGGAIPNGGEGIRVFGGTNTKIGGTGPGEGNEVANNVGAGVAIYNNFSTDGPVTSTGNSIRGNKIHDNGGLGIGLSADDTTITQVDNDAGDADVGPNNLQNHPDLKVASTTGGITRVQGALSTAPGAYTVDFYSSGTCDPSGYGEGAVYLGSIAVNVGPTGVASVDTQSSLTTAALPGDAVTATATDASGNTSEFSNCVANGSSNFALTSDDASVPAGASNIPLGSIPPSVLGQFAFAPIPNSPIPNSGVGAAPIPNSPIPNSPIPNSPIPNSPIPNSPIANSGFDGVSNDVLKSILLSSIPIDWSTIFVSGDQYFNVPTVGLTLLDLKNDPAPAGTTTTAWTRFETTVKFGQLQAQNSELRGIRFVSFLYGSTQLQYIPPYDQADWCALIGGTCTGVDVTKTTVMGLDLAGLLSDRVIAALGQVTIGQITDPGPPVTPIPNSPIPNSPIPNSPIPNSPIPNSPIPNSALSITAIGSILVGSLAVPTEVVDCSKFATNAACLASTLANAQTLGAIKATATFESLLKSPNGTPSPMAGITFDALAVAAIGTENLPWESWPIDGFQQYAPTGDVVHYHLTATVPCATAYNAQVTLPRGFLVKTGTSALAVGTGNAAAVADPTQSSTGASWSLPAIACTGTTAIRLDFQGLAGFRLGEQTSSAKLTINGSTKIVTGQAPVTVTQNLEPDNTSANAPAIQANTLAIGHIATGDDLDWRSFTTSGLPAGTKITVYLRPPSGTDLDLYLVKPGAQTLLSSPIPNSPIPNSPIPNSPLPDNGTTLNRTSDNPQPEGLQDAPIPNSSISSAGITRGDQTEVAQVTLSGDENGPLKILVAGYNGAHSNDAYTLRVKVNTPPQLPPCPARSYPNASATAGTLPVSIPSSTQTLFLLNYGAMGRTYGQTAATTLLNRLNSFVSAHPELNAAILPVDGDSAVGTSKAAWDASPCSTAAANDVVRKINAVVARYRQTAPNVKYLVIVGGDEQMPMARITDFTTDANESTASGDLVFTTNGLTRANALFASEFLGNILTDDAYAAGTQIPWFGRELYLPQVAVGRLVETPSEISKQLDNYDASDGVLSAGPNDGILQPTNGVVAGYDFMRDEARQIRTDLSSRDTTSAVHPTFDLTAALSGHQFILNSTSLTDLDQWGLADISPYYTSPTSTRGILSVNGHYNHWELAPSTTPITQSTLLPTSALPTGATASQFINAVLFTMGCHGGLNVSDTYPTATSDTQKLRDWAQALAQNGAGVYVANTGYGYGDYDAIALSERLMTLFAHNLASDGSIGVKLALAKQQYFASIASYDPYAEKALAEATFYGLPFYRIGAGADPTLGGTVTPTGTGTVQAGPPTTITPAFTRHDTDRGTYWSATVGNTPAADGGVEYLNGRPVEPRVTQDVTSTTNAQAHGVWIDSLATHDTTVDPLIATPMIDFSGHEPEEKVTNATFPATFATINHWSAFGANHAQLVVVPGQTREGTTQRLVDSIGLTVQYSTSTDNTAPLFGQVGAVVNGGTATLFAHVADASGVSRVQAYFTTGGSGWTFVPLSLQAGTTDLYVGTAPVTVPKIEAAFEAQDGAGNVAFTTDKGFLFTSTTDTAGPQITIASPIDNGVFSFGQAVPASFSCFDDGGVKSCSGPVANGANIDTSTTGTKTFTVTAIDLSGNTATATATYTVVPYPFNGFFQPVDNPPSLNSMTAGQAVPVKFSLSGNRGLSIFAAGSPSSQQIGCSAIAPVDPVETTVTASTSGLTYDATSDQYTYVWKTDKSWAGTCRQLNVKLVDGTIHTALFKFK